MFRFPLFKDMENETCGIFFKQSENNPHLKEMFDHKTNIQSSFDMF